MRRTRRPLIALVLLAILLVVGYSVRACSHPSGGRSGGSRAVVGAASATLAA